MDKLLLTLDSVNPPGEWFAQLLDALPGDWHVEASALAWRGERIDGGAVLTIGLSRPATDGPWVITWRVDGDVPDHLGLIAVATGVALGTGMLFLGGWLEWGLWSVLASAGTVMLTLETSKHWIRFRLPDVEKVQEQLGADLMRVVAASPGAEVVEPSDV
jgi:hypothetical protein